MAPPTITCLQLNNTYMICVYVCVNTQNTKLYQFQIDAVDFIARKVIKIGHTKSLKDEHTRNIHTPQVSIPL